MLAERFKVVPLMNSANVSTGADCDSIDMSGFHKATFLFSFGTVTTDIVITPMSGVSETAKTTAVPSYYAAGGAIIGTAVAGSSASCDVLAAWTYTATTVPLTAASNKFLVVEIKAADMTSGHDWLTLTVAAGTSGICYCVAILIPRYSGNRSVTCLK
jgi:hypothetical protein